MGDQRFMLDLSNEYGRLEVRRIDGAYFVELANYTGPSLRPISEALARLLCAELRLAEDDMYADQAPMFEPDAKSESDKRFSETIRSSISARLQDKEASDGDK